ncbi:hypothetical protein [Geoalkalibacter halelectricus]|uniref:hypothetical protein n=1 Tax=Geoalkalibacter halelectricus TaxID=2847045 RepID=UPI003D22EEF5
MIGPLGNQKGITVRNLLLLLALIGALGAGTLSLFFAGSSPRQEQAPADPQLSQHRLALRVLAADLRAAQAAWPGGRPGGGILSAGPTNLTFRVNPSGEMAESLEPTLTFILSAGNLVRNDGSLAQILADNLDLLEFSYLLANGRRLTSPSPEQFQDIRAVDITLIASNPETTDAPRVFRLPSGATFAHPTTGPPRRMLSTSVHLRAE